MTDRPDGVVYDERLALPWWGWLLALAIGAALLAPFAAGAPDPWRWLVLGLLPAAAAGLWWLGRIRVAVAGDTLLVDDARLPVRFISEVVVLDPAGRRELLGPAADPLAFVVQRPWISGAVQIVLDDPADPTPYWLVSSGQPDRLAAALRARRRDRPAAAGRDSG